MGKKGGGLHADRPEKKFLCAGWADFSLFNAMAPQRRSRRRPGRPPPRSHHAITPSVAEPVSLVRIASIGRRFRDRAPGLARSCLQLLKPWQDRAPTIKALQARGATSLRAIAAKLNEVGVSALPVIVPVWFILERI
jgi:hypothetical protein